jgi:plasmid stabilization system protein ParE
VKRYAVEVADVALAAIAEQARYLNEQGRSAEAARRWLEGIWRAVDSLELWPLRASRAEEDDYVPYEVRRIIVGDQLLLFTVDEARQAVVIVGLRHGRQQVRWDELPRGPSGP